MGKGWSYGGEVFVQKKTGRFTGMMGYTLSWTNRQFPTINNGKIFPYKYDRRHDFKIAGVYRLNKRVEFSGEWIYGTGNSISLPAYRYSNTSQSQGHFGSNDMFFYAERNKYRMKSYHRLDLGVNLLKKKRMGEFVLGILVFIMLTAEKILILFILNIQVLKTNIILNKLVYSQFCLHLVTILHFKLIMKKKIIYSLSVLIFAISSCEKTFNTVTKLTFPILHIWC